MKKSIHLLIIVMLTNCARAGDDSIDCICEYLGTRIEEREITNFTAKEGVEVWREWSYLTNHISEEYQPIEDCKVNEYLANNYGTSLGELKGQMLFVYSVHSYLNNGRIQKSKVKKNVNLILD